MGKVSFLRTLAIASVLAFASCGSRSGAASTTPSASSASSSSASSAPASNASSFVWPQSLPRVMTVVAEEGPALFQGPTAASAAIGFVSGGMRVRVEGDAQDGRVPVTIAGPLTARGFMPLTRLQAATTKRGRLDGTPAYFGAGDFISPIGLSSSGVEVQVRARLDCNVYTQGFRGTLPIDFFAAVDPNAPADPLTPGTASSLPPRTALELFDRPNGAVVFSLPAIDATIPVTVVRAQGEWSGVRIGRGPYLVGFVRSAVLVAQSAEPTACPEPSWAPAAGQPPQRVADEEGPLFRVARGTRVRFLTETIAVLRQDAFVRELGRVGSEDVDVFLAVDNGAAVRGLVTRSELISNAQPSR